MSNLEEDFSLTSFFEDDIQQSYCENKVLNKEPTFEDEFDFNPIESQEFGEGVDQEDTSSDHINLFEEDRKQVLNYYKLIKINFHKYFSLPLLLEGLNF